MTIEELTAVFTAKADEAEAAAELERKKNQKAEQARINGRNSKGPNTPEGKARSSRNGIRHGLTANENTVLEAESLEEYDEVRSSFIDQFRPATKCELRFVEKAANIDWRLERLAMMDTALKNLRADLTLDEIRQKYSRMDGIGILILSWLDDTNTVSGAVDRLRRYIGTLEHQLNATLSNFRKLKADRLAEARAGDTFGDPPYEEPKFDTFLKSEIEDPPPSYDEQFGDEDNESQHPPAMNPGLAAPPPSGPRPSGSGHRIPYPASPAVAHEQENGKAPTRPPTAAPLRTEPTPQPKISHLQPIPKRPAA